MKLKNAVLVALDVDNREQALKLADELSDIVSCLDSFIFTTIKDCIYKDCNHNAKTNKFKEKLLNKS
ncbi:MAG: hypothetical protein EOO46_24185 [Flavobacterium sp.]|nr:MAG: hypothetical protein EOO46_24185 [Flavobacterium sp.]